MNPLLIPIAIEWVILVTTLTPVLLVGKFSRNPRLGLAIWFATLFSAGLATAVAIFQAVISVFQTYFLLINNPLGSKSWLIALVSSFAPWLLLALAGISLALVNQRISPLLVEAAQQVPLLEAGFRRVTNFHGVEVLSADLPIFWAATIRGKIVISTFAIANLSPAELDAVLWHELGHIRGRHNTLKGLAGLVQSLSPWFATSRALVAETARLAETDADLYAANHVSMQLVLETRERFISA